MPVRAPRPPRRPATAVAVALATIATGCGSATVAELPAPAGPRESPPLTASPAGRVLDGRPLPPGSDAGRVPVDGGARVAAVLARERTVELSDARTAELVGSADAGVGPTNAISNDRWLWVTDTQGDALLVFRTRPEFELVRRVYLPGGPYAIALDTGKVRLWVTLTGTNEVAELPAHGRPRELRRFPTVRQPNALAVDSRTHRVSVAGVRDGVVQLIDPGPLVPQG